MKSLLEFFKWFYTLSPSQKTNITISFVQIALAIAIAEIGYRKFVGDYQIINYTNIQQLIEFFISGRVFLCGFLVVFSWFLFNKWPYKLTVFLAEKFVHAVYEKLWRFITKGSTQTTEEAKSELRHDLENYVDKMLIDSKVVAVNKDFMVIKGEKYSKWMSFIKKFNRIDPHEKYKLPFYTLSILFQFSLIYFFFMKIDSHWILDIIVVALLISYFISFIIGVFTYEMLSKGINVLSKGLNKVGDYKSCN